MLKRPTPKKLSPEDQKAITNASSAQTGTVTVPKSYDKNFPVFEIPVNKKILVYVPNHTDVDADGNVILRADRFAAHPILMGRSYLDVRCNAGIDSAELHTDGSCPFCDAVQNCWELYNFEIDALARQRGIDRKTVEGKEALKEDSKKLLNNRAVKEAVEWIVFPIVVIDTEDTAEGKSTVVPKLDASGYITGKACYYKIRKSTFIDKFGSAVEAYNEITNNDLSIDNLGGQWLILDFTYAVKDGQQPTAMLSAKELRVTVKPMSDDYKAWAEYLDKQTEAWDVENIRTNVVFAVLRNAQEQKEACNEVMKPVEDKLVMYQVSQTGVMPAQGIPAQSSSASAVLEQLGNAEAQAPTPAPAPAPTQVPTVPAGELPNMGV